MVVIMQKKNKIFFLNLFIIMIIFLIDRISKTHVINLFENLNNQQIFLTSFLFSLSNLSFPNGMVAEKLLLISIENGLLNNNYFYYITG